VRSIAAPRHNERRGNIFGVLRPLVGR